MLNNNPNFERVAITLQHKEPDRVPLAEAAVAYQTMSKFLGKKVTADDLSSQIEFWIKAGYDYIALTAGVLQPGKVTEDSEISKVIKKSLTGKDEKDQNWNIEERIFIKNEDDFKLFPWEEIGKIDTNKDFYEVQRQLPSGMKIVALSGKIFTLSWLLMGYENFCINLMLKPKFIQQLIERVAELQYGILKEIIKIPDIAAIWAVDDLAFGTGPMIQPQAFRDYIFPWYKKFSKICHDNNKFFFFHSDGYLWDLMDDLLDLKIDALHPIDPTCMDIEEVKRKIGDKISLFGNISNELLQNGTTEEIVKLTKQRLKIIAPGGGYCIGSGNSVPEWAQIENYIAMIETVKKYGIYPINVK
ncbi:MAG: uroporphyrinogen decarboxylase family protein [Atribacterota bacterium]|nr:uroporphyrinogen decarboxylase family protein [Atribacterota bacterium]